MSQVYIPEGYRSPLSVYEMQRAIEFIKNTVQRTLSNYDERFSAVAESGSYNDLSDKPTIPEAYDDTALAARVTAVEDGKASLQVAAIPGGGGGEEINALVSQGENSVSVSYYKDGTLPDTLNLNVDSDYFSIPATGYVDEKAAQAQSTAQTYTDLKLTQKQNTLVSGTNIKTINDESLLGGGNISIGGGIAQFEGTSGIYAPNDRRPRNVANHSFLVTDAIGMEIASNGSRSLGIVSGYALNCQSAPAGSTVYQVPNTYQNRIIAKMAENGYAAKNEAASTTQQIVQVLSVKINGSAFTPSSAPNDDASPIEITVAKTLNPDDAITQIRLFGIMGSYASVHVGNGIKSESGGRSLMLGGAISKAGSGNDICAVGNAIYTGGNGNAIFGKNHISTKNRWLIAGEGHDTTSGISEGGAVVGKYADIQSDTAFAIGNGTSHTQRSNLFEIKTNGDIYVNGVKM